LIEVFGIYYRTEPGEGKGKRKHHSITLQVKRKESFDQLLEKLGYVVFNEGIDKTFRAL
jgi:hypothetical protein